MADTKNSLLLDQLIEHAQKIGEENQTALTAELFLIAVCDYLDGTFSVEEENDKSREELFSLLKYFAGNIDSLKRRLHKHIENCGCD